MMVKCNIGPHMALFYSPIANSPLIMQLIQGPFFQLLALMAPRGAFGLLGGHLQPALCFVSLLLQALDGLGPFLEDLPIEGHDSL